MPRFCRPAASGWLCFFLFAALALQGCRSASSAEDCLLKLRFGYPEMRTRAHNALVAMGSSAVPLLTEACGSDNYRFEAIKVLLEIGGEVPDFYLAEYCIALLCYVEYGESGLPIYPLQESTSDEEVERACRYLMEEIPPKDALYSLLDAKHEGACGRKCGLSELWGMIEEIYEKSDGELRPTIVNAALMAEPQGNGASEVVKILARALEDTNDGRVLNRLMYFTGAKHTRARVEAGTVLLRCGRKKAIPLLLVAAAEEGYGMLEDIHKALVEVLKTEAVSLDPEIRSDWCEQGESVLRELHRVERRQEVRKAFQAWLKYWEENGDYLKFEKDERCFVVDEVAKKAGAPVNSNTGKRLTHSEVEKIREECGNLNKKLADLSAELEKRE